MSDPESGNPGSMDSVTGRFEEAWKGGTRPRIEGFLIDAAGISRVRILEELLRFELAMRRGDGEIPDRDEYRERFPEHAETIDTVFDASPHTPSIPATPRAPITATPHVPIALAGYEVVSVIGRGGMGVVYKAWQVQLNRFVAIKRIAPGASVERFRREARLIAQINSPHVVDVYDLHPQPDGGQVLVMEYVEGTNLARMTEASGGRLAEPAASPYMCQVAQGMLAAAERKIIHRDLKPSNILVDTKGRARVADFGLARGPADLEGQLTEPDVVLGTPYYMAPEQAEDPQGVDTRADIYSYGATFYHALTGTPPFRGKTAFSILYKHKTEPLVPPRARSEGISPRMSELLERCLAKSPADRFPSFSELLTHLEPRSEAAAPWEMEDDPAWAAYLEKYKTRCPVYLHGPAPQGECDRYQFPGGRTLRVIRGDIVEQRVDAVVSSVAWALAMNYGVALAIARRAGMEVAREASRFAPVRPGRVVVTSAGQLPARFIFHGVTMGPQGNDFIVPSRDIIAEILASCFYHADSLNVQSIAIPLLGTGAGGFSREICLETTFRWLARSFLHGLTCVQDARIVIYPLDGS